MSTHQGVNRAVKIVEHLRWSFPTAVRNEEIAASRSVGVKKCRETLDEMIAIGLVRKVGRGYAATPPPFGVARSDWVKVRRNDIIDRRNAP